MRWRFSLRASFVGINYGLIGAKDIYVHFAVIDPQDPHFVIHRTKTNSPVTRDPGTSLNRYMQDDEERKPEIVYFK